MEKLKTVWSYQEAKAMKEAANNKSGMTTERVQSADVMEREANMSIVTFKQDSTTAKPSTSQKSR